LMKNRFSMRNYPGMPPCLPLIGCSCSPTPPALSALLPRPSRGGGSHGDTLWKAVPPECDQSEATDTPLCIKIPKIGGHDARVRKHRPLAYRLSGAYHRTRARTARTCSSSSAGTCDRGSARGSGSPGGSVNRQGQIRTDSLNDITGSPCAPHSADGDRAAQRCTESRHGMRGCR